MKIIKQVFFLILFEYWQHDDAVCYTILYNNWLKATEIRLYQVLPLFSFRAVPQLSLLNFWLSLDETFYVTYIFHCQLMQHVKTINKKYPHP